MLGGVLSEMTKSVNISPIIYVNSSVAVLSARRVVAVYECGSVSVGWMCSETQQENKKRERDNDEPVGGLLLQKM